MGKGLTQDRHPEEVVGNLDVISDALHDEQDSDLLHLKTLSSSEPWQLKQWCIGAFGGFHSRTEKYDCQTARSHVGADYSWQILPMSRGQHCHWELQVASLCTVKMKMQDSVKH